MNNRIMNLVNFVRGCEPRKQMDLVAPVIEEIKINQAYGFKHTFLLQYDVLLRDDMFHVFREYMDENMEIGIWFEMCRALTETVGIEWRGRPGFDWDWYVNPGFLQAYTPKQRENIIDEVFRLFKERFGFYPKVAGSWLLDAHSMAYMSERYEMDAFCICREQYAVDAYTLWGGYYSGGYYPSKNNALCPAQHEEFQISTPVFRMLGIDPIYGYDEKKHNPPFSVGCYTMEPVWDSGKSSDIMDWYYQEYYTRDCLSNSHATTGQENGFGWDKIHEGYCMQAEKIDQLQKNGIVRVETLGESGRSYKKKYLETPAAALSALSDWAENNLQSVWYSSKNWRSNLFFKDQRLYFRDIQKFDDRYRERYLTEPCTAWQGIYDNLPVIDNRIWSDDNAECALSIVNGVKCIETVRNATEDTLEVIVRFLNDYIGIIRFSPETLIFENCGDLMLEFGKSNAFQGFKNNQFFFVFNEFPYSFAVEASVQKVEQGFLISSKQKIVLQMNLFV